MEIPWNTKDIMPFYNFDRIISHFSEWIFYFSSGSKWVEKTGVFMIDANLQNINLSLNISALAAEQMAI